MITGQRSPGEERLLQLAEYDELAERRLRRSQGETLQKGRDWEPTDGFLCAACGVAASEPDLAGFVVTPAGSRSPLCTRCYGPVSREVPRGHTTRYGSRVR